MSSWITRAKAWKVVSESVNRMLETAEKIIKEFALDPSAVRLSSSDREVFILYNKEGYDIHIFRDGSAVIYNPSDVVCYVMQKGKITKLYIKEGDGSYSAERIEEAIVMSNSIEEFFRIRRESGID